MTTPAKRFALCASGSQPLSILSRPYDIFSLDMGRTNALDCPWDLPNLLDRYVHGAVAASFCVALMIVLSCCTLSAQPAEDPQTQFKRGTDYWYGQGVSQDYVEAANWFRKAA